MNEQKKRSAAIDMVFGILLVFFSIYIIFSSLHMKFLKSFIDGAGFFPLIIGVVLVLLGAVLTFIGIKAGGVAELKEVLSTRFLKAFIKDDGTLRVLILVAMMAVYIFLLLELIGFLYATPIYLFVTFMYLKACKKLGPIPGWMMAAIISVATSMIVYHAFRLGLGVTLP